MKAEPLLRVVDLRASHGRLAAVKGISFDVPLGGAVAIVGPNGAGKSTALNAIAGGVRDVSGTVVFAGNSIARLDPEVIALRGLSLVPEGRHVFASLSVAENLHIGGYLRSSKAEAESDLHKVLQYFPRLKERLHQAAGKLSGGEQQMLVLGRALMTRPKLLLIDEPSLGLAPKIVDQVYDTLHTLRQEEGLSLLVNEQNSKRVLKYMDDIHVLREGAIQLSGKSADLNSGSAVADAYFGHGAFSSSESWVATK
jgi:branched-chain amino acid transport system ATP-binding protein